MGIMATYRARRAHRGLLGEIDRAVALGSDPAVPPRNAPAVSQWSVHQQLEHLWSADRGIMGWLTSVRDGTASDDGPRRTVPGTVIMWTGWIPRGKGRAPEPTKPAGRPMTDVLEGLRAVRGDVERLAEVLPVLARSTRRLRHPLLGHYNAVEWLRFLEIHHRHHRRIIEDILRRSR